MVPRILPIWCETQDNHSINQSINQSITRTTWSNSTKLDTNHPWVKRTQVFTNNEHSIHQKEVMFFFLLWWTLWNNHYFEQIYLSSEWCGSWTFCYFSFSSFGRIYYMEVYIRKSSKSLTSQMFKNLITT